MFKDVLEKALLIVLIGGILVVIYGVVAFFRSFQTMPTFVLVMLVIGVIGAFVFSLLLEFGTRDLKKYFATLVLLCILMTAPAVLYVIGGIYQGYLFEDYSLISDSNPIWLMFFLGVGGAAAFSYLFEKTNRPVYLVPAIVCCLIALPGIFAAFSSKP
jgi:hypothetical protein